MQINTLINSLPCSKSYANRALVYSYIYDTDNKLLNLSESEDVQNTINAIKALKNKDKVIDLGEGGTTIRFVLCAIALGSEEIVIKVHPRFKQRPIEELFKYLEILGAKIKTSNDKDTLCTIKGPLKENMNLDVDCSKTSQFASGLLLISERINLKLNLKNFNHSKSYYELTKKVIADLKSKEIISVPVDSSSSVYFICFALFNQNILFEQIFTRDPSQADDKLFDVLDSINAKYEFTAKGLVVYKTTNLKAFDFNVSECLDLSMALVYIACFVGGQSRISGIKNLKYKEVDRIKAITQILDSIGADYNLLEDSITIEGQSHNSGFDLSPMADHRAVMVCALFLYSLGKEVLDNKNCVNKSFPNFFSILSNL